MTCSLKNSAMPSLRSNIECFSSRRESLNNFLKAQKDLKSKESSPVVKPKTEGVDVEI